MDYADEIIDHYKNPRNFGEMEGADITVNESNSSCGDVVQVQVKFGNWIPGQARNDKTIVEKIAWRGVGCAISTAAASMLSEKVEGMSVKEIEDLGEKGIIDMMGGEINAGRMKCATLAYRALLKALKNEK